MTPSDSVKNTLESMRFPWKIFSRLVVAQTLLILVALGASGLAGRYHFKKHSIQQTENQLVDTLQVLIHSAPTPLPADWCEQSAAQTRIRITVVSQEGKVFCDSHHDAATMENHANRPEIVAALHSQSGDSVRHSKTLNEWMIYVARLFPSRPIVVRAAYPLSELRRALGVYDTSLLLFLAVVALILALFAAWSGKELVGPIRRLLAKTHGILQTSAGSTPKSIHSKGDQSSIEDEDDPNSNPYGEWSDLESFINEIRRDLESKVEALMMEREQQATLMAAISDAILAVDLEGTPLFFNSRFAMLAGATDLQKGRKLWEILREPEVLEAYKQAMTIGKGSTLKGIPFEFGNERSFYSVAISPLHDGKRSICGAVGIFHDVTELKRTEQMRIDFVANVSHELRTPLTAIKGFTDTLAQDMGSGREPQKEFLEVIKRNVERLMSLIQDLLDLSSLESGEMLQRVDTSTSEITARVLDQLQGSFKSKGQSIRVETLARSVFADPKRLEQVLVNLLDNAHKYTPQGGQITVRWENSPEGDALLKVTDTGPGIPPEHQSRLFERFYRVDRARSRAMGGTGLGLAIVKHILQRHEGEAWVDSTPGNGASFLCRFPKADLQART